MDPLDQTDPRLVGGCRLLARIGSGGMGRVFLGLSPGGEPRAVKTARSELSEDPTFRARFAHEVRNARAVSGPWTVPVLDAGVEQSVPWMVTEYVAGPSLQDVLTHHGALPPHALYALTIQLSHALDAIHQAGLVHRDLKPSNVLLSSDGPRVIDFGIARATDNTSLTLTGFAIGSPGYLPPEQVTDVSGAPSKRSVEPAGDVFSLAAVLVFASCGRGPFGEGAAPSLLYRVVHEEPALDGVPDALRDVLASCLCKEPSERPSTSEVRARTAELTGTALPEHGGEWLPEAVTEHIAALRAELEHAVATPPPAPEGDASAAAGVDRETDGADTHDATSSLREAAAAGYGAQHTAPAPPTGTGFGPVYDQPPTGYRSPTPDTPRATPQPPKNRRRRLLLACGVAAAVVVGAGAWLLPDPAARLCATFGDGPSWCDTGGDSDGDVPQAYLGHWKGSRKGYDSALGHAAVEHVTQRVSVRQGDVGEIVGTSRTDSPERDSGRNVGCTYAMKLTSVEKNHLVLAATDGHPSDAKATKKSNLEACPPNMTYTLRADGDTLRYSESGTGMEAAILQDTFAKNAPLHRA